MTDIEIEIKSEFKDLETTSCSEPFKFSKILSRKEKISVIILIGEDLLALGFLGTFKPSA